MASEPPPLNDPFAAFDGQRTFVRPTPAGWAAPRPAGDTTDTMAGAAEAAPPDHGLNPLLAVANRLLMLVPQLRQTRQVGDPSAFRWAMIV